MKFSQEQVDNTIIPKMEMFDMSKKSVKVGKELVKRTKNLNKNTDTIMGKSAKPKPKTQSLPISDGLVMYLYDAGDSARKFIRMDFNDYSTYDDFFMILDRQTLRNVAEFITSYLDE